ncbi:hypothetical protein [Actinomadura madurae]|uniref:hypothetical protein n=1 Tax=Actinomadura madurae TaxID=1993 RepID=UPI0020D25D6A|nr:hypothetical protein [Actinomadura madurae]MCP9951700.1 hypothetical protein [Actinomadura madurae]MCP9968472.1 hypothetical protein [Actinomadura madurae]MCP9980944.1 hypothetical protein [Actinomadura madurae]MCQ0007555.1 hypothetical protein [Actinomadura madurae]MCQ0017138.1 hypothetical protein [Actinomadura madurae]
MEELEAIKRRLAKVRREISSASEELQRLRAEEYGLMLSIARLTGQPLPRPVDEPPRAGRQAPRITPVIREILSKAEQPLTRTDIVDRLLPFGVKATPDAVSASLSYLRRTGAVTNAGGLWSLHRTEGAS